jgi:hypothetical protein
MGYMHAIIGSLIVKIVQVVASLLVHLIGPIIPNLLGVAMLTDRLMDVVEVSRMRGMH